MRTEPGLKAFGDVSLIGQLVSILLENAFKYSDEGGSVELTLSSGGRGNKLVVSNTVEEIDGKNLDRLFDRFYRAAPSRNSETGGSGVGLSIAKSIVGIHKGKISVKSDDGRKISFTVVL